MRRLAYGQPSDVCWSRTAGCAGGAPGEVDGSQEALVNLRLARVRQQHKTSDSGRGCKACSLLGRSVGMWRLENQQPTYLASRGWKLGETDQIDGMAAVTLLSVSPASADSGRRGAGVRFEPGWIAFAAPHYLCLMRARTTTSGLRFPAAYLPDPNSFSASSSYQLTPARTTILVVPSCRLPARARYELAPDPLRRSTADPQSSHESSDIHLTAATSFRAAAASNHQRLA